MSEDRLLVLVPKDAEWRPNGLDALSGLFASIGLTGAQREPGLYSTGPAYLDLISYLGCSPQITLGEAEAATTIRLVLADGVTFRSAQAAAARCKACRKSFNLEPKPAKPGQVCVCPHCGNQARAEQLDWKHKAAFGSCFVEISNVYESEAVPGETLLEELQRATGQDWDYFYL